jgi:hypothetical protein
LILYLIFLLQNAEPDTPAGWFDASIRAHRAMRAGTVGLEAAQVFEGRTVRAQYELAYVRPNQIKVRIREPEQTGRPASDRTFALIGDRLYAYDAKVHERLEREVATEAPLAQKFSGVVGQVDDTVLGIVEPERLEKMFAPFRGLPGWKVAKSGGVVTLRRQTSGKAGKGVSVFRFDAVSRRLRGMEIEILGGRLQWTVRYGAPPRVIGYRPPADAAKVASFTASSLPPRYASAKARAVAEFAMLAYDRLKHVSMRIESGAAVSRVWISGGKLKEETPDFAYTWDGKTAAIRRPGGALVYSGEASFSKLLQELEKAGGRMDPLVRQIVTRQNPIRILFIPGTTVRHVGQMTVGGAAGEILEFKARGANVSVVIRKDNGLIASMRTDVLDPDGRVVSTTQRDFSYGSVGKPIGDANFSSSAP